MYDIDEPLVLSDSERATMHRLLNIAKQTEYNKSKRVKLGERVCGGSKDSELIEQILSSNGINTNIARYLGRLGYRFRPETVEEGMQSHVKIYKIVLYLRWD